MLLRAVDRSLRMLGYRRTRQVLKMPLVRTAPGMGFLRTEAIVPAVTRAALDLEDATCLRRCVAMAYLLQARGVATTIEFGVKRTSGGQIVAHAWLTGSDGVLHDGGEDPGSYQQLDIPAGRSRG